MRARRKGVEKEAAAVGEAMEIRRDSETRQKGNEKRKSKRKAWGILGATGKGKMKTRRGEKSEKERGWVRESRAASTRKTGQKRTDGQER